MRIDIVKDDRVLLSIVDRPESALARAIAAVKATLPDEVRLARREWAEKLKDALIDADLPLPPITVGRFKHEPPRVTRSLLTPLGDALLSEANARRQVKLVAGDREVVRAWVLKHFSGRPLIRRYELAGDAWVVADSLSKQRVREHFVVFKNLRPPEPTARWLAELRVACDCPWHLRWRCYNAELLCTHSCMVLLEEAPWMFKPLTPREAAMRVLSEDRALLRRLSPELKAALLSEVAS